MEAPNPQKIQEPSGLEQFLRCSLDKPNGIKKAAIKISSIALFVFFGLKICKNLPFIFAAPLLGIDACLTSLSFSYPDEILTLLQNAMGSMQKKEPNLKPRS